MNEGFVMLPHTFIRAGILPPYELAVYLVLLSHRDHKTGRCWPSYATIAKESGVSDSKVKRIIRSFEDRGLISIMRNKNLSNVYTVPLPDKVPARTGGVPQTPPGVPQTQPLCPTDTTGGVPQTYEEEPLEVEPRSKNQGEDVRSAAAAADVVEIPGFKFETTDDKPATEKQITYLSDLYIHITGEAAPTVQVEAWRNATAEEANETIKAWNRNVGRHSDYAGPEYGDPAYNRLSTNGQDAADRGLIPDDLFGPPLGGDAA